MSDSVRCIVGLGNPGQQYEQTRHNAGEWFVRALALENNLALRVEKKFHGLYARWLVSGQDCHILIPTTFMNLSGRAVSSLCHFYKIPTTEILVAHDELDLPAGSAKLKKGGGHGGHNGLRDIIEKLGGEKDFYRLRVGIGHPGHREKVLGHVLGKASQQDQQLIEKSIASALDVVSLLINGQFSLAMQQLHSQKIPFSDTPLPPKTSHPH